ncbi:MAG: NUDIX domain-containing protein [Actinomycetota bacterium]
MGPFSSIAVTVDLVVFTIRTERLHVLTVTRGVEPFEGRLALPGGFVLPEEDLDQAAGRELAEETGLGRGDGLHLEQLATYGTPGRDPRQRVVTVAYLALAAALGDPTAGTDAAEAQWLPVEDVLVGGLAFDHDRILDDGLDRARAKLEYTTLATTFCPPTFTVADLRQVYEAVWGVSIDPRNFHRKVVASEGFVEETGERTAEGRGRPAMLFRAGPATALHPPIVRQGSVARELGG